MANTFGSDEAKDVPVFDDEVAELLEGWLPCCYHPFSLYEGYFTFHKLDLHPRTGETIAYYDLVQRRDGREEIKTFMYGYRDDDFVELKRFPVRFREL
ncbi:hypothetical protein U8C35_06580 [Sinorhizobium medicae]|uniref:hypothetical protein n=1 Tax=Sinorhizobium medicae TaxID=110321 RepID=UPI002AF6A3F2|nr:hypothetical protein [Sinorhizobium medicae]WQO60099.1 hypothetical protein U8C35_06580 [Sinorhizobium medicae]